MYTNPRLEINLRKIRENAERIIEICSRYGVKVMGVTKSFSGDPRIARAFTEAGITSFADSRLQNIVALKEAGIKGEQMLLRIPMKSEAQAIVTYADISVNSELETIRALSDAALTLGKKHKILLMVDVGDLREGVWPDQVLETAKIIAGYRGVELIGLGTNVGCYGGVLPTYENTAILAELAEEIRGKLGMELPMISAGGTCALKLVEDGQWPEGVNYIRVGEAITFGMDTTNMGRLIEGTHQDAFKLVAEIVELKEKPSVPIGPTGYDAFHGVTKFEDKGIRKRAICAIGKQDMFFDGITPIKEGIEVLGGSSDHLLLDVTDCSEPLEVGSEVGFRIMWSNMLRLTTSPYVQRVYIE
jgi:predicted amino acid racemase